MELRVPRRKKPLPALEEDVQSNPRAESAHSPSSTPLQSDVATAEFLGRDLAWLEFNRRVLHEALDARTPLLERVRFLGIFTSNLDEFFMKRVGRLKRNVAAGAAASALSADLDALRGAVISMIRSQADAYRREILPALTAHDIHLCRWDQLTPEERKTADSYFRQSVFRILTPLAVDPGHPFPFISNLSTSLGVTLRFPDSDERLFARVKIPTGLPTWIRVDPGRAEPQRVIAGAPIRFVSLTDVIQHNLDALFPDMVLLNVMPFRVTRNADIERDEEDTEDLLELIEQELHQRRFERVVRLEHGPNPEPSMLALLMDELQISESDVYEMPAELDFTELSPIVDLHLPAHKHQPWTPVIPPALVDVEGTDFFSVVRKGDILVHHPYESFSASVERFIRIAAEDPRVLAIKMTVYRTGDDSPFIPTLIRAANDGKHVVCLVELKARFDEERNIYWAQQLEQAGVHVVYGIVGLKTHTKTALVVRQEPDGLRCYAHIGTGNYHVQTARLYTDLGLFTAKPEYTDEVVELFNYLTGRSRKRDWTRLLVAPLNMKERFLSLIDREITHAQSGRPCGIIAKMNSFDDAAIGRALYRASVAGVGTDLVIRGLCTIRPLVPGLSERVRVISVIGRFLEHSRIFYFRNGADDPLNGEFYIGSADWMHRNLQSRVEAIVPVEDRPLRERLWEILQTMLSDQRQAWEMRSDGSYTQRQPSDPARALGTHQALMNAARQMAAQAAERAARAAGPG